MHRLKGIGARWALPLLLPALAAAFPASAQQAEDRDWPLFPLGARQAAQRGYKVQRAFGASALLIHNVENLGSDNLAVAFALNQNPPPDAKLIEVPFVTTDKLRGKTTNTQFKADFWLFPFLNLFAGIGKAKGDIDIGVNIDLDAFVPPPACTPLRPCGSVKLPFTTQVDNTTAMAGVALAYGADGWFATAIATRTLTVSGKDRSDIRTTDLSARIGPRFHLDRQRGIELMPYAGANRFDMHSTVNGTVQGPLPSGQTLNLRYRVDLFSDHPWAVVNGVNFAFGEHWSTQAEYEWGRSSDRIVVSLTFRP